MKILFIKTFIFSLLLPGMVAVVIPRLITKGTELGDGYLLFFGLLLMGAGLVIYSWCVWDFVTFGKGTPAPIDSPKYLVVRGLYQYTRNPMYIAVLTFISGWLMLYALSTLFIYWLCVAAIFQVFVVFYEEPMLLTLFGSQYEAYKTSVNRWIPQV